MFSFLTTVLLQLLTAFGQPTTNDIGGSGWGHDANATQVGSGGWGNDIGGSGWGHDANGSDPGTGTNPGTGIGGSGWGHD